MAAAYFVLPGDELGNRALRFAVLASVVFHAFLFVVSGGLLKQSAAPSAAPGPIVARLIASRPASSDAAEPGAVQPALPSPPPPPTPPRATPVPTPAVLPVMPSRPAAEARPVPRAPESQQSAAPTPQPNTATQAGPVSAAPAAVAPAPQRIDAQPATGVPTNTPAAGASADEAGLIGRYKQEVIVMARKYKINPRIPGMRDIKETTSIVRMVIGANGFISSITVVKSAGHEVLDRNAMTMVRNAKTRVDPPSGLRGREFSIDVPVIYQFEEDG